MKGTGHRQKPKFKGKSGRSRYTRGMQLHNHEPLFMLRPMFSRLNKDIVGALLNKIMAFNA